MRILKPVPPTVMPPTVLPVHNLVPMVVSGLLFQLTAAGSLSFAAAAWMCLLPLLVLARAVPLWQAIGLGFAIPFVGRAAAFGISGTDGAIMAAATVAALTVPVVLSHRLVMRELPVLGSLAAPCAVVVVEWAAGHWSLPGAALLPLSSTQAADVPFFRWVDLLTPLGISFGVAWAQGVMAGFGEAWIAPDPHSRLVRERGLRVGANLCFWSVIVVGHVGGFFRPDPTSTATHQDTVAAIAAVALVGLLIGAVVAMVRRTGSSNAGGAPLAAPEPLEAAAAP